VGKTLEKALLADVLTYQTHLTYLAYLTGTRCTGAIVHHATGRYTVACRCTLLLSAFQ
jgi:hypothetical protein